MADKKISDYTETTSVDPSDWFEIENTGGNSRKVKASNIGATFRGALVYRATDAGSIDYTGSVAVSFDEAGGESYDTDSFHDHVTNPTRLTVPSGVSKVRLTGGINYGTGTSGSFYQLGINKNASNAYPGSPQTLAEATSSAGRITVSTAVLSVSAADYFELIFRSETDNAIVLLANNTYFSIEVIE